MSVRLPDVLVCVITVFATLAELEVVLRAARRIHSLLFGWLLDQANISFPPEEGPTALATFEDALNAQAQPVRLGVLGAWVGMG